MSRPSSITDDQIIQAAREVFLERGIQATTAEVARRAGVAEGSIFNRFPSKSELFRAAIAPQLEEPEWLGELERRAGVGDPRATLVDIGHHAIAFLRSLLPLAMMSWSNPTAKGLPSLLVGDDPPPLRITKRVAAFFAGEIRARRLRKVDPELLARTYLATLQNYVFFEIVLHAHDRAPMPEDAYLRGVIGILFDGVATDGAATKPARKAPKKPAARPRATKKAR